MDLLGKSLKSILCFIFHLLSVIFIWGYFVFNLLYNSVGGGSVMDTAKAANLFSTHPHSEGIMAYVNKPIGLALAPPGYNVNIKFNSFKYNWKKKRLI